MAKGFARSGFDIDLLDGEAREAAFRDVLLKRYVEHKADERCRETGNVFIEFRQKGRPSGLAVTEADYWAIEYAPDCRVVLPTAVLREVCQEIALSKGYVRGGDGDNYDGVLVPIERLVQVGRVQQRRGAA